MSCDSLTVSHDALGVPHDPLGVSHDALGVPHDPLGVPHDPLGVSHDSSGVTPSGSGDSSNSGAESAKKWQELKQYLDPNPQLKEDAGTSSTQKVHCKIPNFVHLPNLVTGPRLLLETLLYILFRLN